VDAADTRSAERNLTLVGLYAQILRGRRFFLGLPLALFALVVGVGLAGGRTYTSYASFIPATSATSLSRLTSLAAQFGVPISAGGGGAPSPDFYADLVRSRELLRALVGKEYAFEWQGASLRGDLVTLLEINEATPGQSREIAVKRLGELLNVSTSLKTGVVSLSIRTRYAPLSLMLANEALHQLNQFNLESRQVQAGAERQFTEGRLAEAQAQLREAEDRMQRFFQQNREYRSSPQLSFEQARLQRVIDLQQQVVLSLAQAYEQSRIEEVRNTPVITAVEAPIQAVRPDSQMLALKGLLALIVGAILATGILVIREEFAKIEAGDPGEAAQLRVLWRQFLQDLRHPLSLLRRRKAPSDG